MMTIDVDVIRFCCWFLWYLCRWFELIYSRRYFPPLSFGVGCLGPYHRTAAMKILFYWLINTMILTMVMMMLFCAGVVPGVDICRWRHCFPTGSIFRIWLWLWRWRMRSSAPFLFLSRNPFFAVALLSFYCYWYLASLSCTAVVIGRRSPFVRFPSTIGGGVVAQWPLFLLRSAWDYFLPLRLLPRLRRP